MNYSKTPTKKLIEMLKAAQKNETKLAAELAKSRKIAEQTMVNNARLRDQLKSQPERKKEGVFSVGDRVEYYRSNDGRDGGFLGKVGKLVQFHDTPENEHWTIGFGDGFDDWWWVDENEIKHADAPAPTCPDCAAKQKRVEELEKDVARKNKGIHRDIMRSDKMEKRIEELERRAADEAESAHIWVTEYDKACGQNSELRSELEEYKRGVTAELATKQQEIDTQAATIDELADECEKAQLQVGSLGRVIVKQAAQLNGEVLL
jgi:hypothetical protein